MAHGLDSPSTAWQALCLLAGLLFAGVWVGCSPTGPAPTARNVIVILPDTLRADHLGTYGYERDTTPYLDSLGRRGVVFERAVSQASCTFPSANSILTSRYPAAFIGRPAGQQGIPEGIPSLAEILDARDYDTVAVSASPIVRKTPNQFNHQGGFDRGFDVFDESCEWAPARCVNQRALEYLEALPGGDRPFFLYLHYMDPHDPYWRPPEFRGRFAQEYTGGKAFIAEGNPNPIGEMLYDDGPELDITEEDRRHLVDLYDEAIAYFDAQLAALLLELGVRGLLDDTLIAVVSDHGEEFLEHGHIKHCRTVFDTEIKTPLILAGPVLGVSDGGLRVPAVVENLDLVPTILDYLGIDPSLDSASPELEGVSLRPLIEGRTGATPNEAGLGGLDGRAFSWQATKRSVTEERYKLIFHFGRRFELYDLQQDPQETRDVLQENRRTYARLRETLTAWMDRTEPGHFQLDRADAAKEEEKLKSLGYLN